jgi:hypothetical protein
LHIIYFYNVIEKIANQQRRGWTAIINDSLIGKTLSLGILAVALGTGLLGCIMSIGFDITTTAVIISENQFLTNILIRGIIGLILGALTGSMLTNTITSAVATVFVCFAEDPKALKVLYSAAINLLSLNYS